MPNAKDIPIDTECSILLVGDSGTKKTTFIGTCPQPSWTADFDKGFAVHAGKDMDYDMFKELPYGEKLDPKGTRFTNANGWYEYGTAWPAYLKRINEIGKQIDAGTCPYKTISPCDSLTLMTDVAMHFVLTENKRRAPEQRDWQAFLNNMSEVFSQLTAWPLVKVFTAHIKRDENQLTGATEFLPLVPGQFSGKVSVYFDEVYFTQVTTAMENQKAVSKYTLKTSQGGGYKQAKSRLYNVPDGTPTDFNAVLKFIEARRTQK